MKAFAILAALGFASALAYPLDATSQSLETRSDVLHDLLLNVTSTGENSAVVDYSYEPGVDYYELLDLPSTGPLRPRTTVNIPGVGERITIAFRIASVTLIRTAANILEVELDNLVDYTITVALNWFSNSESDKVPARATAEHSIDISGNRNGQIKVTASRFS